MNNSPFEIFRRNLKPLMVVLIGLAMFSFVVLPALQTYLQRNQGVGDQIKLATFDGKTISEGRVAYLTRNHQSTVRFLRELAEETIRRSGIPKTPGFRYDSQNGQITALGISEMPSERLSVKTLQFASEAKKAGFELDDTAISSWLSSFTDGLMSDGEIDAMLMQSTRNQMGRVHLYEQLRNHLLADLYQRSGFATVAAGQMPIMTPAEEWHNFLKLNREATVDAYGVLVSDYVDKTNASPSEAEIKKVYEAGKDVDSYDQSPDPAFHRRYTANFEYLVADLQTFIDEEAAKFSEEELRAEYERRLAGGEFQIPDDTAAEAAMGGGLDTEVEVLESETVDVAMPTEQEPASAAENGEQPNAEEATAEEATAEEATAEEATAEEATAEEATAEEATAEEATAEEPAADAPAPVEEDQSSRDRIRSMHANGVRLVSMQEEDEEPAAEPEMEEQPAAEPAEAEQADAESEPAVESAELDSPSDAPMAQEADTSDESPAEAETEEVSEVESFEEVRNQIADSLARPIAMERMNSAVIELDSKMRRYFGQKAIHDSNVSIGQKSDPPTPLDLKAMGEALGFRYAAIGPHSELTIADEPIASSLEVGSQQMQRGPSFVTMMYGGVTQQGQPVPRQEIHSPLRTVDDRAGRIYVSWKNDQTDAYTPELDEVRAEVIEAIRFQEARKLAIADAEKLAADANAAAGKDLVDFLPEDQKDQLLTGLGPFSWMDSFGFQGASIGNVPELDSVGEAFMETVFESEVGACGVALNQPERVVYVVKTTGFQPDLDALKARFKEPRERMMAMLAGGGSANEVLRGFYESVDKRTGFEYLREDEDQ
ncbi:hypothetical protein [Novipirellula artificiosorum]|uniref:Periplasmic folding chaperone n=1 Tax=Novipirellula artificiosorum TaxID=2528016 RepID=A0A5C6DH13_9BACT|nr:hypothetical protein [Novipirellula artificiosorum]TWU35862.1 hypothetical protein Poly41_36130 [Novipirellula artificiosorum]